MSFDTIDPESSGSTSQPALQTSESAAPGGDRPTTSDFPGHFDAHGLRGFDTGKLPFTGTGNPFTEGYIFRDGPDGSYSGDQRPFSYEPLRKMPFIFDPENREPDQVCPDPETDADPDPNSATAGSGDVPEATAGTAPATTAASYYPAHAGYTDNGSDSEGSFDSGRC